MTRPTCTVRSYLGRRYRREMANEAEIRRWNDQRWTRAWPAREALTSSVTPYLLAAMAPTSGQRVLDIGCGGGGVALALAPLVAPDGGVVGCRCVRGPLLRLAGERAAAAGVDNVEFLQLDMQSGALEQARFDLAVSQFGVMFFDEPIKAFANIGRHLHRGGGSSLPVGRRSITTRGMWRPRWATW